MTGTPEILSLAVRAGLLSGGDAISGAAHVVPVPRTNGVHCVQRRGRPIAYCKQPGVASLLDGDDVVGAERFALTRLHALGLTPPLIPHGGSTVVWTGVAAGRDLLTMSFGGTSSARLAESLGRMLARLHTAPIDGSVTGARPPWPLLPEPLPSMTTHPASHDRDAVLASWREPAVLAALRPLATAWSRCAAWTHGDLSATNLVVDDRGEVTLIDLESAGRGDPCWDVVTLEQTLTSVGLPAEPFRQVYVASGGPGAPYSPAWRAVRALVTAWQHAAQPDTDNQPIVEELLLDARRNAVLAQEDSP
ncbi:phosphotransferase family protein [Flexivirga oryzae]|uniref:Aminoglycoside phosphotransferase domain-containing protein n=1 Tax=Flexivirga oryzae TaxID=1794944 RepID=A0A839N6Q8_9MICO|nr:aminoglycoside phosphotransferase family protein [Flexivirga oryzae]MBB2891773.1 hypothetical protein [Flexivirga oryzae]